MFKRSAALFVGGLILVQGLTQGAPRRQEALTSEEAKAGFEFAKTFNQRFQQTRDIAPLARELFVKDFEDHLSDQLRSRSDIIVNHKAFFLFYVDPALIPRLRDGELQNYFVQTANFWHLTTLYSLTTLSLTESPKTFAQMLVPEVAALFRKDPSLSALPEKRPGVVMNDTSPVNSGKVTIRDANQFRRAVNTLERASAEIRPRVSNPPAEETSQYRELSREFEGMFQASVGKYSLAAGATTCVQCGRLPKNTRFIEIIVLPFLHLHLVRVDGQLRIFAADLPTD